MADAVVAILFLGWAVALGVCSYNGWCADTRDPEFGLGRAIGWLRAQPVEKKPERV